MKETIGEGWRHLGGVLAAVSLSLVVAAPPGGAHEHRGEPQDCARAADHAPALRTWRGEAKLGDVPGTREASRVLERALFRR